MANKGWIKLERKILDNPMWEIKPFGFGQAFIDLLLLANHEDALVNFNGRVVEVKRGQHFTSIRKLAKRWGWSENKVRRYLGTLMNLRMAEQTNTPNGTLVSIVKYDFFQSPQHTDEYTDESTDECTSGSQTRNKEYKNKRRAPTRDEIEEEKIRRWLMEDD